MMATALIVLLLIALLYGVGFAADIFWLVATVFLVAWLIGFAVRGAERTWYRW